MRVESEFPLPVVTRQSVFKQMSIQSVLCYVFLQGLKDRGDWLKRIDLGIGTELMDKKGEEADVCPNIKNTIAICKRDAVLQIAVIDKDLIVEPLRLNAIKMENAQTIGQAE